MKKFLHSSLLLILTAVLTGLIFATLYFILKNNFAEHLLMGNHFFRKSLLGDPTFGFMVIPSFLVIILYLSHLITSYILELIFKYKISYISEEKSGWLWNKTSDLLMGLTTIFIIVSIVWSDFCDYAFSLIYIAAAYWVYTEYVRRQKLSKAGFNLLCLAGIVAMTSSMDKVIGYPENKWTNFYLAFFALWIFVVCYSLKLFTKPNSRKFTIIAWAIMILPILEFTPESMRQVAGKALTKKEDVYFTKIRFDGIYAIDEGERSTKVYIFRSKDGQYPLEETQTRQYGGGSMNSQVFRNGY